MHSNKDALLLDLGEIVWETCLTSRLRGGILTILADIIKNALL